MKRLVPLAFALLLPLAFAPADQPLLGFDDKPPTKLPEPAANPPAPAVVLGGAAAAIPQAPATPAASVIAEPEPVFPEAIRPRGSVRFDAGDGVGYTNGFTYVEAFLPLYENVGNWLLFNNLRAVNFQNADLWEINAGLGLRRFNSCTERVLGVHAEYDGRTTLSDNYFNQITVGWESLGPRFDVRNNFYIPVGTREYQTGQASFVTNPRFFQNFIIFNRSRAFESSLGGLDFEAGGLIAARENWNLRGYLGGYHYSGSGLQDIDGIRGRLEANIGDSLSLYFQVQNDAVNDTLVSGGVAFFFGPGKAQRGVAGATPYDRMGERVVRDPNIVTGSQTREVVEPALDVETGKPILVRHAASYAAPGGDGTFERPYRTLGELQTGSIPRDILFVHANSVMNNQQIVLQDRQRFLGEGLPYLFTSKQGTYFLPRATSFNQLPIVQTSAGTMVTLANNVEVAGFQLRGAGQDAIFGQSVRDVYMHNLTIANAAGYGVRLVDVTGNNLFVDSSINGVRGSGVSIENSAGLGNFLLQNLTIADTGLEGVGVILGGGSQTNVQLLNASIANIGRNGFVARLNDSASGSFLLDGVTITNTARNGIALRANDASQANLEVQQAVVQNTTRNGVSIATTGAAVGNILFDGVNLMTLGRHGVDVDMKDASRGHVELVNSGIVNAGRNGLNVDTAGTSSLTMNVLGNVFFGSGKSGAFFDQRGSSSVNANLDANTFNQNPQYQVAAYLRESSLGSYTIANSAFSGPSIVGVDLHAKGASQLTAVVKNNTIQNGDYSGVHLDGADQAKLNVFVDSNKLTGGTAGVDVTLDGQSVANLQTIRNVITGTTGAGVSIFAAGASLAAVDVAHNTIADNPVAGIILGAFKSGKIDLTANANTIERNGVGIDVRAAGKADVKISASDNTIQDSSFEGVRISTAGNSTLTSTFSRNLVRRNDARGFDFDLGGSAASIGLFDNVIRNNGLSGVYTTTFGNVVVDANLVGNTIRGNRGFGVNFQQDNRSNVTANISDNTIVRNLFGNVRIDMADRSVGDYTITGNTIRGTLGSGVAVVLADRADAKVTLTDNRITRSLLGGVRVFAADQSKLAFDAEDNRIAQNLIFGAWFIQSDKSQVNARLANNDFANNFISHVFIDVSDKSFGAYQLAFNDLNGGLAAALIASSHDSSTLYMQLFGNTTNRPVFLVEDPGTTFRLEKTLATNTIDPPGFIIIDPSIFPLAPFGSLGFPPP